MSINVKLSEALVDQAKLYASVEHRSVPKQIEYWSQIGKIAVENPDLSFSTIQAIAADTASGEAKVGDLAGIQVYKFKMTGQLFLLAYRVLDTQTIKLLMAGPHENFYRDLKRVDA